nr:MAG TPA: hypothetical protein [Caudoviricetes sp.]
MPAYDIIVLIAFFFYWNYVGIMCKKISIDYNN